MQLSGPAIVHLVALAGGGGGTGGGVPSSSSLLGDQAADILIKMGMGGVGGGSDDGSDESSGLQTPLWQQSVKVVGGAEQQQRFCSSDSADSAGMCSDHTRLQHSVTITDLPPSSTVSIFALTETVNSHGVLAPATTTPLVGIGMRTSPLFVPHSLDITRGHCLFFSLLFV